MKSQTQSQKITSNTLGEELRRTLREEIAQNFPREFVAQFQGEKKASQEIFPGQSICPTENQESGSQEKRPPFAFPFYRESQKESLHVLQESAAEINNKMGVEALKREIKEEVEKIKETCTGLSQELDNTAAQENLLPTPPSRNLFSFLENLLKTLRALREKIEDSQVWLAASAQRQSRRNFFWGQVKKSGSKFLLSSDRTPATQTG
ncbi:hypothetical protein KBI33_00070 [Candidatus Shapirobacteria bacterium]|nr:hypothetical protein [Candidatus Shapirobacteria bacterium]